MGGRRLLFLAVLAIGAMFIASVFFSPDAIKIDPPVAPTNQQEMAPPTSSYSNDSPSSSTSTPFSWAEYIEKRSPKAVPRILGSSSEGIVRLEGAGTPDDGWEWVAPGDPKDFRVRVSLGLVKGDKPGEFGPAPGFRWTEPNNPNSLEVQPREGLSLNEDDNSLSPSDGWVWVNGADERDFAVVRETSPFK
jgi:hypothetical protein